MEGALDRLSTTAEAILVKRHTWHIGAYQIDSTKDEQPVILPGPQGHTGAVAPSGDD